MLARAIPWYLWCALLASASVAIGVHWFDFERFHAECRRVLVPGGAVAVWTYEKFRLDALVDAVVDDVREMQGRGAVLRCRCVQGAAGALVKLQFRPGGRIGVGRGRQLGRILIELELENLFAGIWQGNSIGQFQIAHATSR